MENQEKILQYIKKNPGHTQAQISYRLEIPQSTMKYHLLQLSKENKIFSEKLFKNHFFPIGIDNKMKIKTCIESNNNLNNIQICQALLKITKKKIKIGSNVKIKFVKDRPGHDLRYALNSQKIKNKWF